MEHEKKLSDCAHEYTISLKEIEPDSNFNNPELSDEELLEVNDIIMEDITALVKEKQFPVQRGDIIWLDELAGDRNDGRTFWDGEKVVLQDFTLDEYGNGVKQLPFPELPPHYFQDTHNNYIWVSTEQQNIESQLLSSLTPQPGLGVVGTLRSFGQVFRVIFYYETKREKNEFVVIVPSQEQVVEYITQHPVFPASYIQDIESQDTYDQEDEEDPSVIKNLFVDMKLGEEE